MKLYFVILMTLISTIVLGQNKYDYTQFNKLTELKGSEYVIASIDNRSKTADSRNKYLLFINTSNGRSNQVDFPGDGNIDQVEQVKIDELELNIIIVSAKTVDLDGKGGIDWSDPQQLFVLSVDGKDKTQLTEDKFYSSNWTINNQTGSIVITGHYDTNGNGKYDKSDKNEILIFDLKSLELKNKL